MTSFVVRNAPNTLKHYQNALKPSKCKREYLAIGASAFSAYRLPDVNLENARDFHDHDITDKGACAAAARLGYRATPALKKSASDLEICCLIMFRKHAELFECSEYS